MPEDLAWKLLELGRVIDPPKTAELYAPLQEKEPYQGVKVERDIQYGPADRNLLDVFVPEATTSARPVLMFVHGGAFVGGNKIFLGEAAYRDAERGGGVGLFLLLHETGHTTGIADEHAADCFSLTHIRDVLRRFWQLRPVGIAARYGEALSWPGKYDGNRCAAARVTRGRFG
jgi:hypothetical protein